MTEFTLGSRLQDKVTGFTGIATSRIEYLSGCIQYCLSPPVDKDGKIVEGTFFDVQRLDLVSEGVVTVEAKQTGGASGRGESPPSRY